MSKFRLLSARILILSSRAYLLAWETGRRPVVMNGAKVLGHVISERRPAGSESEARHVLGIAAFLLGSALSDGTSSCSPLWLSRSATASRHQPTVQGGRSAVGGHMPTVGENYLPLHEMSTDSKRTTCLPPHMVCEVHHTKSGYEQLESRNSHCRPTRS